MSDTVRLFDVNVLLALGWPNHAHHDPAHQWRRARGKAAWATSSFTEAGFIRISSIPRIIEDAVAPAVVAKMLDRLREMPGHVFWSEPENGVDSEEFKAVIPSITHHKHVTDAFLVATARRHGGRLATFDRSLSRLFPEDVELVRPPA